MGHGLAATDSAGRGTPGARMAIDETPLAGSLRFALSLSIRVQTITLAELTSRKELNAARWPWLQLGGLSQIARQIVQRAHPSGRDGAWAHKLEARPLLSSRCRRRVLRAVSQH